MESQEYKEAVTIVLKGKYREDAWDLDHGLSMLEQLGTLFPEEILKYYLSGLDKMNNNATRKEYTRTAKMMLKVSHMYLDIMKDEGRWRALATKVKRENLLRPAFQEEFAKVVPGWRNL